MYILKFKFCQHWKMDEKQYENKNGVLLMQVVFLNCQKTILLSVYS